MNPRIFKPNSTTDYLEYFIVKIENNTIKLMKYVFGFLAYETHSNIGIFKHNYPNYLDMSLEEFFKSKPFPTNDKVIYKNFDAEQENLMWQYSSKKIKEDLDTCKEITKYAVLSPVFGILEAFNGAYQNKMVVPFLNGLVDVAIFNLPVEEAEIKYKELKKKYIELRLPILIQIYNLYDKYKKGNMYELSELKEGQDMFPIINNCHDIEDVLTPKEFSIDNNLITIRFDCPWDDEHGVNVYINFDWVIEVFN